MASEEKLDKILEELELNTDIIKSQLEATQALLQESANPNHKIKFEKTILKIKELSQIEVKTSSNASRKMSHVASENTNGNSGSVWFPKSFEDFLKKPFNIDKGILDVEMQPCKQGCAIHPLSLFVQIWRSLYSCLIVLYVAILPIGIGVPQEAHILLPVTLLHTFLVSLDSIITINTGIIADQELEMDRRVVWRHHWKQKYLLKRFLVGFPYALVVDLSTQAGSLSRFDWRALSLINGLSIVQLLQSTDASYLSEKATQIIRIREINPTMVKFVYILVAIIFYW
ncbi:hypothetical protein BC833DRAFT_398914 [Globomyces pollinis-pini]|nr:hypothetical protein BC833DRAFT_398914 [Globomyces pollinis-pini]